MGKLKEPFDERLALTGRVFEIASERYKSSDYTPGGIPTCLLPQGFRAGCEKSGAFYQNRFDLGLLIADIFCGAAAHFPRTSAQAAPVLWSEGRTGNGRVILVNSGQANSLTGKDGLNNCRILAESLGELLHIAPEEVLLASVGIPGVPLKMDSILGALPKLTLNLADNYFGAFASSILTDDKFYKMTIFRIHVSPCKPFKILACGEKSSSGGNYEKNPLLAFAVTDFPVNSETLEKILHPVCAETFDPLIAREVSYANDSVFVMSSGTNGDRVLTSDTTTEAAIFRTALRDTFRKLAEFLNEGDDTF
jgi:glutamate N-acetyltransferase/amino-acid N-acetyltransferase